MDLDSIVVCSLVVYVFTWATLMACVLPFTFAITVGVTWSLTETTYALLHASIHLASLSVSSFYLVWPLVIVRIARQRNVHPVFPRRAGDMVYTVLMGYGFVYGCAYIVSSHACRLGEGC